jgi:uncharacterized membrane protein
MVVDNGLPASRKIGSAADIGRILDHNISALLQRQSREQRQLSLQDKAAIAITAFAGSMAFVYLHLVIFGLWILINIGWLPVIDPWDESLVVLAMVASVEAIFISTFVLISQNRMSADDSRRADLNLQISLLAEHETTRILTIVSAIAERLDVQTSVGAEELDALQQSVDPDAVLDELERNRPTKRVDGENLRLVFVPGHGNFAP